jgi:hypothetical protein
MTAAIEFEAQRIQLVPRGSKVHPVMAAEFRDILARRGVP